MKEFKIKDYTVRNCGDYYKVYDKDGKDVTYRFNDDVVIMNDNELTEVMEKIFSEHPINVYNENGKQFLIGWKEGRISFTYPNGNPVETFNIHEYHPINLDVIWDLEYALIYYGFDIVTALGIIYKLGYEFCLDDELERMRGFIKAVQKKKEHERRIKESMKSGIWRYGD